ncbi:MAG: sensor histidine kinase [Elainellaceae cyanobacterium]
MQLSQNRLGRYLGIVLIVALAYLLTSEFILSIPAFEGKVSPVWPPAGIGLGALLVAGSRVWPGLAIGAFWLDYSHGGTVIEVSASVLGTTLQAVVGASLLRRVQFRPSLDRVRDVIAFISLAAILATCINATISSGALLWSGNLAWSNLGEFWGTFWLGDSMGVLIVAPVILTCRIRRLKSLTVREWAERIIWLGLLLGVSGAVYGLRYDEAIAQYPIKYLPFPLVIWAALRFGVAGGVLGNFLLSTLAIAGTLSGAGPFAAQAPDSRHSILILQAFLSVITITTLVIAAAEAQHQKTDTLLRRSEASLANAQRIAQLGNWDFDQDGDQWTWSDELYCLLGLHPKTTSPNPDALLEVVHPDDRDRVRMALSRALSEKMPYSIEYRVILPDQSERLVCEHVEIQPTRITGTIQDITEAKQTEVALLESQEKFSKAFGFSPDSITISTLEDGRFIDVNESFLRMTGYRRDEVIGRTSYDLNLWSNYADRENLTDIIRETGAVRNHEYMFLDKANRPVITLTSIEVINLSDQACLLCVARDITERKRAEEHLRRANERDRLLGEIALRIRESLDLDEMLNTTVAEVRRFLRADRVFLSHFDAYGKGTIVAESVSPDFPSVLGQIIDSDVYQEIQEIFNQTRVCIISDTTEVKQSPFFEECVTRYQVRAAVGVPIIVDERLFGVLVAHQCSMPRTWTPFESDLLERLATQVAIATQQAELYSQVQNLNVNLERQVAERTAQLQQKMQELQELNTLRDFFLHAITHDLSTTVKGMIMLLTNLQPTSGDQVTISRNVLERMIQAGGKQLTKLNSLQEVYTIKTQGIHLHRTPVALLSVLEGGITEAESMRAKHAVTLTQDIPSESPIIYADARELTRVFNHLLRNAILHNPPGTDVTLKIDGTNDSIFCSITDNGVGISPEKCDRLFDLCIGCPSDPHLTGIGLGLYLCRQIISAHQGEIGVQSIVGNGTTVWFTLPRYHESID